MRRPAGADAPTGTELAHDGLSNALRGAGDVTFTRATWAALQVGPLRADHYVAAGDAYYRPADAAPKPSAVVEWRGTRKAVCDLYIRRDCSVELVTETIPLVPSNFYTGLKFSSKKNFYGRVAADANFSDLFSALLRPHSGRREF